MPATLGTRLEKILFIVREIELAGTMARLVADDDLSRTLGRRVLVRTSDLITHSRAIRKSVQASGGDYDDLKQRREALAEVYAEYLKKSRDKFAAHVQDVDLAERLDLWFGIDAPTLAYFVEGAREIYEACLGTMSLPGFTPYSSFPEVVDSRLLEFFAAVSRRDAARTVVSSDALALSRPNTVGAINLTPVHQRAGQLAALDRWVRISCELEGAVVDHENVRRLLHGQLVTDVVSFADCLVTRPGTGEKQELAGLDQLFPDGRGHVLGDALRGFAFDRVLGRLRAVRNEFGAHLEENPGTTLHDILTRAEALSTESVLADYERLRAVFHTACRSVVFLQGYLVSDQVLHGVLPSPSREDIVPFDPARPQKTGRPQAPHVTGTSAAERIKAAIVAWREDRDDAPDHRTIVWEACMSSDVVEARVVDGAHEPIQLRLGHKQLFEVLGACSDEDYLRVLRLMDSLSGGDPDALAEILIRSVNEGHASDERRLCATLRSLGQMPVSRTAYLLDFLAKFKDPGSRRSPAPATPRVAVEAFVAELGIQSLVAFHSSRMQGASHIAIIGPLTQQMDAAPLCVRTPAALAIGGRLVGGKHWFAQNALQTEHSAFITWARRRLALDFPTIDESLIRRLSDCGDWCSLTVLLGEDDALPYRLRRSLLELASDGVVSTSRSHNYREQGLLNRALADIRLGRVSDALSLLAHLRSTATDIELLVGSVPLAAEAGSVELAQFWARELMRQYDLSDDQTVQLAAVESWGAVR